jgi:glycerol-3-phosphate cytidylyltransferase
MKTVLTYGTYDLLHKGHVLLLERAKKLGDRLIVGLSTDAFNELKGKRCFYSYEERYLILSAIRHVDMVIPEETWDQKVSDIQAHDVDVFVMGDDWKGKFDHLSGYCEVVYLPRTENISTTEIIEAIGRRQNGTAPRDAAAREEGPAA